MFYISGLHESPNDGWVEKEEDDDDFYMLTSYEDYYYSHDDIEVD